MIESFVLMRGYMRKRKVRFNDSPGSPSSLKRTHKQHWGESILQPAFFLHYRLRQVEDSLPLPYTSSAMARVHHVSLAEQRTAGVMLGWTFMCDPFLSTVPHVILGLGKAQRHLKQSGLPRLKSLE